MVNRVQRTNSESPQPPDPKEPPSIWARIHQQFHWISDFFSRIGAKCMGKVVTPIANSSAVKIFQDTQITSRIEKILKEGMKPSETFHQKFATLESKKKFIDALLVSLDHVGIYKNDQRLRVQRHKNTIEKIFEDQELQSFGITIPKKSAEDDYVKALQDLQKKIEEKFSHDDSFDEIDLS